MDEFEKKIKKKLEEMRADILSKTKIPLHIPKEERADITDLISVEKIRNVENISMSIYTDILKLIERALDKIQNGNYGYCEICGDKIDKERLEEVPHVRYCIDCQERVELEKRVSRVEEEKLPSVTVRISLDDSSVDLEEEEEEKLAEEKVEEVEEPLEEKGEKEVESELKDIKISEELDKELEEEIEEEVEKEIGEYKSKILEKEKKVYIRQKYKVDKILDDFFLQKTSNHYLSDLFSSIGTEYYNREMYEKSTEYFTKAIKLNPTNPFLFYQRGKAYYKTCSYDKAIKDFTKAIRIKEDAELYYRRGFCYYEMKLYNQAIKDFSKAIKLNPNDSFFYYGRGSAYLRKGLYNKAIQDFTRAIDLNPTKDKFYQQRGLTYLGKGLYEKAIEDFSKAIELYPHNPEFYRSRGIAYELMGLYDKAQEDFKKAMELEEEKKKK